MSPILCPPHVQAMDQQAVNDICQTIQAAQELLESGSIPGTTERPSKKAVAAVADKLKTDVAKGTRTRLYRTYAVSCSYSLLCNAMQWESSLEN